MQNIYTPSYSVPCELCSIGSICLSIFKDDYSCAILNRKRLFEKNDIIAQAGEPLNNLLVIHSGCLKSYAVTSSGAEQITGFYLPGDILGFEAISSKKHYNSIQALTKTSVCEVRHEEFMSLMANCGQVRDVMVNLMSQEILNQQKLILMLSQKNAEERLASFIYLLYTRYALRGHVSLNIKLSVCRSDIANYLGLTIETISRIFTRLQQLNILAVKGKHILIKNLPELIKFSGELE
ncbi:cyclic nucleotide-binding domain-containing protein [Utexia brackfieldae]|uniref:cyclic nucleotide-binding domain-containing protein n=1 Tax=Utexia brackfieldae TaxID=3074108 RepID=UPI00370DD906